MPLSPRTLRDGGPPSLRQRPEAVPDGRAHPGGAAGEYGGGLTAPSPAALPPVGYSGPVPLPDDRESPGSDHLARLAERRERHRRRPLAVRVLTVGAGGLGAAVGLVLLLPFPEVGVPLLGAGLGALALEFDWAARALARTLRQADRVKRWFGSLHPAKRWSLVGIGVAALGGIVAWIVVSL